MVVNVVRGFEYKLLPNDEQKNYFHQAFGCARKMWNELLQDTQNGVKRSIPDIKRTFTYMYDVDSTAFTSLWKEFMKTLKHYKKGICGFPKPKRKFKSKRTYTSLVTNNNIFIEGNYVKLPIIKKVKLITHRPLPDGAIIKAATIKQVGEDYFISFRVEYTYETTNENKNYRIATGLDYSPNNLYVNQYGCIPPHIETYLKRIYELEEKIKKATKKLSHRKGPSKGVKPSKRWYKQKQEITKLFTKLRNTRKDFLHKESRRLTNHFDLIYVEDLDLKSMGEKPEYNPNEPIDKHESAITKARRKAMFRTGYHQFLTYLEYKMVDAGKELVKVNRWYKSTKKCFMCGNEKDMPTHIRTYECECGHVMNRDINAANNLIKEGLRLEVYKEYPKLNTYHWISN